MSYEDEVVAKVLMILKKNISTRRIRIKEVFTDFDPLKCGRVTAPQFARSIERAAQPKTLTAEEVNALAEHYTDHGPKVIKPQVVNYSRLCQDVDEVFAGSTGQAEMYMSSSPGSTMSFVPHLFESEEAENRLMHALHRLATLCRTRGIVFKTQFTDFERKSTADPSRPNPRRGGLVTEAQFRRMFPFKENEFNPKDLGLLVDRYSTDDGNVHFQSLHNDISEVMNHEAPPFPKSELYLKPDETEWAHHSITVPDKLRSKVVEKRMRMRDYFQDFDTLRKGFCSHRHARTVFCISGLEKHMTKDELEALLKNFEDDVGMFKYEEFCHDMDRDFTTKNLEASPLATISMPDPSTTAVARRNRIVLTAMQQDALNLVEERIRTRVRKRRALLKPGFQDMDRAHRGYVTKNQFGRVMSSLGFDQPPADLALLTQRYCDYGNHVDFNYVDFCKSVDPTDDSVDVAMQQAQSPHIAFKPIDYFDSRGRIKGGVKKGMSGSLSSPSLSMSGFAA